MNPESEESKRRDDTAKVLLVLGLVGFVFYMKFANARRAFNAIRDGNISINVGRIQWHHHQSVKECFRWAVRVTMDRVPQPHPHRLQLLKQRLDSMADHVVAERAMWDEVRRVRNAAIEAQKALDERFDQDMAALRRDLEQLQQDVISVTDQ